MHYRSRCALFHWQISEIRVSSIRPLFPFLFFPLFSFFSFFRADDLVTYNQLPGPSSPDRPFTGRVHHRTTVSGVAGRPSRTGLVAGTRLCICRGLHRYRAAHFRRVPGDCRHDSADDNSATLKQIVPLAFAGALLGDHVGFYVGRWDSVRAFTIPAWRKSIARPYKKPKP